MLLAGVLIILVEIRDVSPVHWLRDTWLEYVLACSLHIVRFVVCDLWAVARNEAQEHLDYRLVTFLSRPFREHSVFRQCCKLTQSPVWVWSLEEFLKRITWVWRLWKVHTLFVSSNWHWGAFFSILVNVWQLEYFSWTSRIVKLFIPERCVGRQAWICRHISLYLLLHLAYLVCPRELK